MAGIFNGPPRGGTRGGKDQFQWDNVKADKDREYYLGHSVKATTGRWQKNKDVYWYTKEKDQGEGAQARREREMAMVKQQEEDLMMEALGLKPKAPKLQPQRQFLGNEDMQKLLCRGEEEEERGDRVKGLGFAAGRTTGAIQSRVEQERLNGVGAVGPTGPPVRAAGGSGEPGPSKETGREERVISKHARNDEEVRRKRRKEDKKTSKRAKKGKETRKKHARSDSTSSARSRSPRGRQRKSSYCSRGGSKERGGSHRWEREERRWDGERSRGRSKSPGGSREERRRFVR